MLLDTHAVLWSAAQPERLGRTEELVADERTELLVSAASAWEIAIKSALGKLSLPEAPRSYVPAVVRRLGAHALSIEHSHALAVAELPPHHRDPFDRLLIVQAQSLGVPLITADPQFEAYDVKVLAP